MAKKHIIIGAGPAGINAITSIREFESEESEIALVTDEHAYSRMVLPYYIAGTIPGGKVDIGDEEFFSRLRVRTLFGKRAVQVQPEARTVLLDDGVELEYDDLLIAAGSSPRTLPVEGASLEGVTNLWTLGDARKALAQDRGRGTEALFIGAGFIGFIILNAAFKKGWNLTVVEVENQVLPRMLDAECAGLVENWLETRGIAIHTGATVKSISEIGGKKTVKLESGEELHADVVVMATGIEPNLGFLDGTGIEINKGILVNEKMETSLQGIYAAGDIAEGPDLLTGGRDVHAIHPTAVEHGKVAGANMAGRDVKYWGSLLINILDICDLQCASFGQWSNGSDVTKVRNTSRAICRKLMWQEDVITGALFVGQANDVAMLNDLGMVKGLIQTRAALGPWKAYLEDNPLDIRRPYVASKVAARLLDMTITGQASSERGYRHNSLQPAASPGPHHAIFMGR